MGLFDKVKKTTIDSRRYEEKLYEVALEEVEAGEIRKGLYAKALSKADGDKEKADGIYLKLRVQSIMDDVESEQINRRENARVLKALEKLSRITNQNNTVTTTKEEEEPPKTQDLYYLDGIEFKSKEDFEAYTDVLEKGIFTGTPDAKAALKQKIEDAIETALKKKIKDDVEVVQEYKVAEETNKVVEEKTYSIDGIKFKSKADMESYVNTTKRNG